ncbi:hypothetical protein HJC23_004109 [Cyclotella cryptica]|uniref:Uncharacterized protein n=1 Tax=Cyclotella cryptica TaxID=29204 RepID=A0ABD3P911_9STRA
MNERTITVLYSTQSGRAKACARRSSRLLRSKYPSLVIRGNCSFDEFGVTRFLSLGSSDHGTKPVQNESDCKTENPHLLLLFVSTTGDGEHTTSISQTWSAMLSKSLSPTLFANVPFALFALGDRAYGDAFCAAGRKLAARLVQLGADPVCQLGYGDDGSAGGVLGDLDGWLVDTFYRVVDGLHVDEKEDKSGEMERLTDGRREVLYSVEILERAAAANAGAVQLDNDLEIHEWQKPEFSQQYAKYFQHSCPDTAYQYNDRFIRLNGRSNRKADQIDVSHNITAKKPPLLGRVMDNDRLTSEEWMQNTRHLRIRVDDQMGKTLSSLQEENNIPSNSLPYQAGDVATILPSNPISLVSKFVSVLPPSVRSLADAKIRIKRIRSQLSSIHHPWPEECTLRGLLTHCVDIQSLPEREDLYALSAYCNLDHVSGKDQSEKLISLSETSGAALYTDYIIRNKRNWVDLFYDFDSLFYEEVAESDACEGHSEKTLLSISSLLSILPSISPRHFSIASAPSFIQMKREPSTKGFDLELCVAVVEGTTPLGRIYRGCCSTYLASIKPCAEDKKDNSVTNLSNLVRLWITPGSFHKLPLNLSTDSITFPKQSYFQTPILCVGAGTGIAPLRALIFEREAQISLHLDRRNLECEGDKTEAHKQHPDNILVFGCRKRLMDYYYGIEWDSLSEARRLRLVPAFSRDQEHKLYVQRALREMDEGSFIAQHILERHGAVYIAGGSKMARAVKDEIIEALGVVLDSGESGAKKLLNKMKRKGLFSIEAWS